MNDPKIGGENMEAATAERKQVLIRMPPALKQKIVDDAFARESNITAVVNEILAAYYGVEIEGGEPGRSVPFGGGQQ